MIVLRPALREVVPGYAAPDLDLQAETSWFVHGFVAVAAWIAAALVIASLFIADLVDLLGQLPVGVAMVAVAGVARRSSVGRSTFGAQLSLAGLLAGEGMIVHRLVDTLDTPASFWLGAAVLFATLIAVADPLHRFLAAVGAVGLLAVGLVDVTQSTMSALLFAVALFAAAVGLFHFEGPLERAPWYGFRAPVAYALLLTALGMLPMVTLFAGSGEGGSVMEALSACGFAMVAVSWLVGGVLPELGVRAPRTAAGVIVTVACLAVLTWQTPGIVAALTTMALGFHRRNPLLVGIGAVYAAGFLSWTYYDMNVGLDVKALILVGSGLVLWAARAALRRVFSEEGA